MFETVSVDDALARGKRMITIPTVLILIGGITLSIALVIVYPLLAGWIISFGLLLSFAAAWLYWSLTITKWRVWAFENVRNVHELKKRAIKDKLIWEDGSAFGKTEIWSADEKMRWAILQDKFKHEDIFNDDLSVPAEMQLRFSKNIAIFIIILGVLMLGGAIASALQPKLYFVAAALGVGGLVLGITGYRRYINTDPQITIGNDGVATSQTPFYNWGDISNEDTLVVHRGKSSRTYFVYDCPEGEKRIDIAELDISKAQFEKLLRVYRGRYEHRKH